MMMKALLLLVCVSLAACIVADPTLSSGGDVEHKGQKFKLVLFPPGAGFLDEKTGFAYGLVNREARSIHRFRGDVMPVPSFTAAVKTLGGGQPVFGWGVDFPALGFLNTTQVDGSGCVSAFIRPKDTHCATRLVSPGVGDAIDSWTLPSRITRSEDNTTYTFAATRQTNCSSSVTFTWIGAVDTTEYEGIPLKPSKVELIISGTGAGDGKYPVLYGHLWNKNSPPTGCKSPADGAAESTIDVDGDDTVSGTNKFQWSNTATCGTSTAPVYFRSWSKTAVANANATLTEQRNEDVKSDRQAFPFMVIIACDNEDWSWDPSGEMEVSETSAGATTGPACGFLVFLALVLLAI